MAALTKALQKTDLHTNVVCLKLSSSRCASLLQRRFLSKVSPGPHLENCFPPLSQTSEGQHSELVTEDFHTSECLPTIALILRCSQGSWTIFAAIFQPDGCPQIWLQNSTLKSSQQNTYCIYKHDMKNSSGWRQKEVLLQLKGMVPVQNLTSSPSLHFKG